MDILAALTSADPEDRVAKLLQQAENVHGGLQAVELLKDSLFGAAAALSWEVLHTGHWKDVDPWWRDCYSLALLLDVLHAVPPSDPSPTADPRPLLTHLLRKLDMAVLMGGATTFRDEIDPLIDRLHELQLLHSPPDDDDTPPPAKRLARSPLDLSPDMSALPFGSLQPDRAIAQLDTPPLEDFLARCMRAGSAAVLLHCMDHWTAMQQWGDMGYLKRIAGHRLVPVEVGSNYLAAGWGQRLMPLGEYLDEHVLRPRKSAAPVAYLAQHSLFEQIPRLAKDFANPDYTVLGDDGEPHTVNVWIGPERTVTPLHYDPDHNLLAQVVGYKYVRLYRQEDARVLAPIVDGICTNTSTVDLDAYPDSASLDAAFPGLASLPYFDGVLSPGQQLYIPPKMWHYVRSLSPSISISFWWR